MHPLVFLDFDGVINSFDWGRRRPDKMLRFDPALIARLNDLLRTTDARVVVSSSHRGGYHFRPTGQRRILGPAEGHYYVEGLLDGYGFCGQIVGVTPWGDERGLERGWEIKRYLEIYPNDNYVILDDDKDAGVGHPPERFIHVDDRHGIQDEHVKRAQVLLRG